jgi:hypothetical protein
MRNRDRSISFNIVVSLPSTLGLVLTLTSRAFGWPGALRWGQYVLLMSALFGIATLGITCWCLLITPKRLWRYTTLVNILWFAFAIFWIVVLPSVLQYPVSEGGP